MKRALLPIIVALLVVSIWAGSFAVISKLLDSWETRGQFGDLFGAVNALFSGLAFAGLIYTVLLQRHELALQREELKLQREEMAKSRGELARQADIQRAQFSAAVAQLRTTARQAEVEALKMESEQWVASGRNHQIQAIRKIAGAISEEADKLDKSLNVC